MMPTSDTVNCMLLWPLQMYTSPKRTSLREMDPDTLDVAVTLKGPMALVGGRDTTHRHMVALSVTKRKENHHTARVYVISDTALLQERNHVFRAPPPACMQHATLAHVGPPQRDVWLSLCLSLPRLPNL